MVTANPSGISADPPSPDADALPRPKKTLPHALDFSKGFFVKLALMMAIDALGIYGLITAWWVGSWVIVTVLAVGLILVNYIYFSARAIPAKYLMPGLVFMLVYQVFVMGYTGYVSLTNYGTGHNSTKADAIEAILTKSEQRVANAPALPSTVVEAGGTLGLAIFMPDGKVMVGSPAHPLAEAVGAKGSTLGITDVPGWRVLELPEVLQRQTELKNLRVPISTNLSDGYYRSPDGAKAVLTKSAFTYDPVADTMTDTKANLVYSAADTGVFTAPDGTTLDPGWRVFVGVKNYTTTGFGADLAWPFVWSFLWSTVFAFLSVATTFALGLALALVFSDERVRGRRIYQSLLILPYAFPAFLSALVWKGMLNPKFGFINQVFLGGAEIPWLTNGWLAKLSVLSVNLWLGFPYMFLICLGALQSLPGDVLEAAKIDGASKWRAIRSITLPLVLVSTTPLLIASFAFNFNNFSLIYMLTGGGPNYPALSKPIGETDILISMVYKIAFDPGSQNYGLASALSIVIFLAVGLVSWLGLRRAKALEAM